jgi:hypothetical protein
MILFLFLLPLPGMEDFLCFSTVLRIRVRVQRFVYSRSESRFETFFRPNFMKFRVEKVRGLLGSRRTLPALEKEHQPFQSIFLFFLPLRPYWIQIANPILGCSGLIRFRLRILYWVVLASLDSDCESYIGLFWPY